jgi:hypothetical protein
MTRRGPFAAALLAFVLLTPPFFLSGCYMSPEDREFFGRGWINPSELDAEDPPPRAYTDPTAIDPHAAEDSDF